MIYSFSSQQKRRDRSTRVLFRMHPAKAKGIFQPRYILFHEDHPASPYPNGYGDHCLVPASSRRASLLGSACCLSVFLPRLRISWRS